MTDVMRTYELPDGTVMEIIDEYVTDEGTRVRVEREQQ